MYNAHPDTIREARNDRVLKWLASNDFMYLPAIWGRHEWTGILGGWSWLKKHFNVPTVQSEYYGTIYIV